MFGSIRQCSAVEHPPPPSLSPQHLYTFTHLYIYTFTTLQLYNFTPLHHFTTLHLYTFTTLQLYTFITLHLYTFTLHQADYLCLSAMHSRHHMLSRKPRLLTMDHNYTIIAADFDRTVFWIYLERGSLRLSQPRSPLPTVQGSQELLQTKRACDPPRAREIL